MSRECRTTSPGQARAPALVRGAARIAPVSAEPPSRCDSERIGRGSFVDAVLAVAPLNRSLPGAPQPVSLRRSCPALDSRGRPALRSRKFRSQADYADLPEGHSRALTARRRGRCLGVLSYLRPTRLSSASLSHARTRVGIRGLRPTGCSGKSGGHRTRRSRKRQWPPHVSTLCRARASSGANPSSHGRDGH